MPWPWRLRFKMNPISSASLCFPKTTYVLPPSNDLPVDKGDRLHYMKPVISQTARSSSFSKPSGMMSSGLGNSSSKGKRDSPPKSSLVRNWSLFSSSHEGIVRGTEVWKSRLVQDLPEFLPVERIRSLTSGGPESSTQATLRGPWSPRCGQIVRNCFPLSKRIRSLFMCCISNEVTI